jgi:hypothetical protein
MSLKKLKGPRHKDTKGEQMYSSTHCSNRHWLEVRGQYQAPAALPHFLGSWDSRKTCRSNLEKKKTFFVPAGMRTLDSSGRGLGR